MARKNITRVIEAFTFRVPARGDSKNTCSTDGLVIRSYAMVIARYLDDGRIAIVDRKEGPSRTTRAQIDAVRFAFPSAQCVIVSAERLARLGGVKACAEDFAAGRGDEGCAVCGTGAHAGSCS